MSFKLVGDRVGEIRLLNRRRREELLTNNIPDDEAVLLKNGTYACTVCKHCPVVDSIDMLVVHRRGKKHVEATKLRIKQKELERDEKQRRDQEAALQSLADSSDTDESCHYSFEESGKAACTVAPLLEMTRKRIGHALMKETPYCSTAQRKRAKVSERPTRFFQHQSDHERECSNITENDHRNSHTTNSEAAAVMMSKPTATSSYVFPWNAGISSRQKSERGQSTAAKTGEHNEHLRYLQLKQSGWLQDANGKWYKDPDVEFDSDEEEPPS
ncbi:sodium channel modifier 1-like [Corticium candelabrum]|uniref:sodium channel modifier 1-like n=1 Tax=Corticium candelabrum TaxID=121492 RepID=UPI002E271B65|nr:sodium channel modifier 1-like [Corticium candelabrum]